jgi:hypothetical protein
LTSATRAELEFNLGLMRPYHSYRLLYLAFHGSKGRIWLADDDELPVGELADLLAGRLKDRFVHFGSCSVVLAHDELQRFMQTTGASVVTGYRNKVDWIDSAAMDLLVLDWAQHYKQPRSLVSKLKSTYKGLVDLTGFDAVFRP